MNFLKTSRRGWGRERLSAAGTAPGPLIGREALCSRAQRSRESAENRSQQRCQQPQKPLKQAEQRSATADCGGCLLADAFYSPCRTLIEKTYGKLSQPLFKTPRDRCAAVPGGFKSLRQDACKRRSCTRCRQCLEPSHQQGHTPMRTNCPVGGGTPFIRNSACAGGQSDSE